MEPNKRLQTYETWTCVTQKKEDLASAGFVYTGERDKVVCLWCGMAKEDWKHHQNPFREHFKLSQKCEFFRICYIRRTLGF